MREIVLDTETTGLNPFDGHRIVEIGAVELWHQVPTGRTYHQYINPERDMPEDAFNVHGISEFLADKPVFRAIAQAFMDFVEDSKLVIHNASFDMRFLNAELEWAGLRTLPAIRRSTRWKSRAAVSPDRPLRWMRCAGGSGSTIPCARSTARCSIPRSSRTSILS
jgi:DNA polymerase III epsilon subunit